MFRYQMLSSANQSLHQSYWSPYPRQSAWPKLKSHMHLATVNISDSLQCSAIKLNFLYKKKIKRMGGNTSSLKNKTSKNITFNKFLAKHIDGYSPVGLPVRSQSTDLCALLRLPTSCICKFFSLWTSTFSSSPFSPCSTHPSQSPSSSSTYFPLHITFFCLFLIPISPFILLVLMILSWKRILQGTSPKDQLMIWLWACSCFVSSLLSTGLSSVWGSFRMTKKPINWPGNPRQILVCIHDSSKINKRIWCLKYLRAAFLKRCLRLQIFSAWNGRWRGIWLSWKWTERLNLCTTQALDLQ